MNRVFISHSSEDRDFVNTLAEQLGRDSVWVDLFDLDTGDILPARIAEAVQGAKWFVLVATRASMESSWVRWEVNMALIRSLEKDECRIIVVRIETCQLHPELSPFLAIDCPNDPDKAMRELTALVTTQKGLQTGLGKKMQRQVVNRLGEMAAVERVWYENIPFICLIGVYGIGKTAFVEKAARDLFHMDLAVIRLKDSHGSLRLALELAALLDADFPPSNASEDDLTALSADYVVQLSQNDHLVFFDDVENAMEEDSSLRPFLGKVFDRITKVDALRTPVMLASTRRLTLSSEMKSAFHPMRIERLDDDFMLYCLENWLALVQPRCSAPEREDLRNVLPQLYGYPLAARLAADYIDRYSVEALKKEIRHFKELRIDIAKQLIGRARSQFSDLEMSCLEALAVADAGLSLSEMAASVRGDVEAVRRAVENLVTSLLVSPENGRIQIHSLIKDYFWHKVYQSGRWKEFAQVLGAHMKEKLSSKAEYSKPEFLRLCTMGHRLLLIAGDHKGAAGLVYDFKEDIREAARLLYHAKEDELALQYMNLWLEAKNNDKDIRWLRARCLTRLGKFREAETELASLEKMNY